MNWHDFAFFDPVMYESLRQLILASQSADADAVFAAMDLAFAIDLCKEEGGGQVSMAKSLLHSLSSTADAGCNVHIIPALLRQQIKHFILPRFSAVFLDAEAWIFFFENDIEPTIKPGNCS